MMKKTMIEVTPKTLGGESIPVLLGEIRRLKKDAELGRMVRAMRRGDCLERHSVSADHREWCRVTADAAGRPRYVFADSPEDALEK